MPIPRSTIRRLAQSNQVYSDALALALTNFAYEITPMAFEGFFRVVGHFADGITCSLQIDNIAEQIEQYSCSCSDCTEGNCRHLSALLLKIENNFFSDSFARGDKPLSRPTATSPALALLMEEKAAMVKARAARRAGQEKSLLIPFLRFEENVLRLTLKAGCQKAYVVKDLGDFYALLTHRKVAPCGKAEAFLYAPENFEDTALAQFILEYYPLCRDEQDPKSMLLTPIALDRFAALYQNRKLTFTTDSLTFLPQPPSLSLYIRRSGDVYRINLSRTDFTLFHGQNQLYMKENDLFYLCGSDFSQNCGTLLECFVKNREPLCVHTQDMQAFYSMILKPASRYIDLLTEENSYIPPGLKTKISLDIDKKKKVFARTEFSYSNHTYYAFDPTRDLKTIWDIEGETAVEELVRKYFPDSENEPGVASFASDNDKLFLLVTEGIPALSKVATIYVSTELKSVRVRSIKEPRLGVRMESDLLSLSFSAEDMPAHVLAAALQAYRQKKNYIRLDNGTFLTLDGAAIKQLNVVTEGLGLSTSDIKKKDVTVPAYRSFYLDSVTGITLETDHHFQQLVDGLKNCNDALTLPTPALNNSLRDYQKFGFRWLSQLSACDFGGILADDMGLGKTLQILSLFAAEKKKNKRLRALVVCPASLVLNWEHEIRHFTPELSSCCVIGTGAERAAVLAQKQSDVVITSYDLLKRDLELYQKQTFDYEIIDEAQYIKNHNTQNAKAVKSISAKVRFALTGTPIENTLAELWSIFDYLMPGYLYRYSRFRRLFEQPIVKDGDANALSELKKLTSPFILRRLKRDVLKELPEKTETVLYASLAEEQRTLYTANLASMHQELSLQLENRGESKSRMMVLAMLTRLRQICCDPSLVYENYKEKSAKLDLCIELIENSIESGHKLLVFSQFTSMLSLLEKQLKHKKIPYYLLEGSTKKEDRIALVNAFNTDETPVFLISLKAGGTGLNLTGADIVIHYDPWWNLSAQNQATDRAHRIGQKKNVQIYKLIAKNTVEEKILALASKKQALADHVLPDENTLLSRMTKEELLNLFK